jgi:hypothetical protein
LVRHDGHELRDKILALGSEVKGGSEAKKRGIGKSTLHYMRKDAASGHLVKIYELVRRKLETPLQLAQRTEELAMKNETIAERRLRFQRRCK